MSTDGHGSGGKSVADALVRQSRELLDAARAEAEQLDLLDPIGPEDMVEAREALGPNAGRLAVVREARERKRGRPKGVRNKRGDDFARYILSFGQHPGITMMKIQSTPPEILMEASARERVKVTDKGEIVKFTETMSYGEAQSLIVRCAEALQPYIESKRPVAVDVSFAGVSDLIIEGVTHTADEIADIVEAEFLPLDDGGEE